MGEEGGREERGKGEGRVYLFLFQFSYSTFNCFYYLTHNRVDVISHIVIRKPDNWIPKIPQKFCSCIVISFLFFFKM